MRVYLAILLILYLQFGFSQNPKIDSLKVKLESASTPKSKANLLNQMALECKSKFPKEGIVFADEAISIAKEHTILRELASAYNNKGMIYRNQKILDSANIFYLKALQIYDEENMKEDQGTILNNIGVIYLDLENYDLAMNNYYQAQKIYLDINNLNGLAMTYNNLAIVYSYQEEYDSAIYYFNKSLKIEVERNNLIGQSECFNNIAVLYYFQGDLESAVEQMKKSLEIDEKLNNTKGVALVCSNLGEIYTELNKLDEAEKYLNRALELAIKVNSNHDKESALINLSNVFEKKKDYQKAYEYFVRYSQLKDSLNLQAKNKQIVELQTKYETEKKDAEILLKNEQIEKKDIKIQQSRFQKIALGVTIFLIIVIFIVIYNRYKLKQQNILNEEIIREREQGIKAVFEAQENERKKIARELHDGIGQQLTGIKMAWQGITKFIEDKTQKEKLTKALDHAYEDVREISHRMMPKSLQEFGLTAAMEDMIRTSFENTDIKYAFEHFGITTRLPEQIELNLFRIAQELCANILKHSKATEVEFQLMKTKQNLIFTAIDNGVGFDEKKLKEGIGLVNIKSRVNAINGNIAFENNNGTIATIRIPIT